MGRAAGGGSESAPTPVPAAPPAWGKDDLAATLTPLRPGWRGPSAPLQAMATSKQDGGLWAAPNMRAEAGYLWLQEIGAPAAVQKSISYFLHDGRQHNAAACKFFAAEIPR